MTFSRKSLIILAGSLLMVPVASADQSADLNVTATVDANCSIAIQDHVAFGNYDFLAADDAFAIGALAVRCTANAQHDVELGPGNAHSGAGGTRRMTGPGGATLDYELYKDLGMTEVWGTGADAYQYTETTGLGEIISVRGKLPTNQPVPAGNYSDVVVATILF